MVQLPVCLDKPLPGGYERSAPLRINCQDERSASYRRTRPGGIGDNGQGGPGHPIRRQWNAALAGQPREFPQAILGVADRAVDDRRDGVARRRPCLRRADRGLQCRAPLRGCRAVARWRGAAAADHPGAEGPQLRPRRRGRSIAGGADRPAGGHLDDGSRFRDLRRGQAAQHPGYGGCRRARRADRDAGNAAAIARDGVWLYGGGRGPGRKRPVCTPSPVSSRSRTCRHGAKALVAGGALWNAGMFVFTAETMLEELQVSRSGRAGRRTPRHRGRDARPGLHSSAARRVHRQPEYQPGLRHRRAHQPHRRCAGQSRLVRCRVLERAVGAGRERREPATSPWAMCCWKGRPIAMPAATGS